MEKSRDPQARHLEILGQYNPRSTPKTIDLKEDRIKYWLSVGAQPSNTVANLIENAGITKPGKQKAKAVRITKKRQAKIDEKNAEAANAKAEAEEAAKADAETPAEDAPADEPATEAPADAEAPAEETPEAPEAPTEEATEEATPEEKPAPSDA